jgi:sulfonate transport system substrate-binding protein
MPTFKRTVPVALTIPALLLFWSLAAAVQAGDSLSLRFAFQDRIGSVIPIVAVKKGFFEEQQLDIKPLRFNSGPACAEALYSGAADIGGMGDTTAIIMVTRSPDVLILASHATGEHRHRIMVREDSAIRTLDDLKGKQLGVKKGTSTFGGLLAALERANIPPTEIRIIDLTPPTMTDALLAGSIDAFAASEPTPSAAEQKGARELITLGGLGNAYPILILARRDKLADQPEAFRRFFRAMQRAQQYAADHPDETAPMMAEETGLALATTRTAMQRHDYHLRLDDEILSSLNQTAVFLKDQKIIHNVPDFKTCAIPGMLNTSR